MTFALACTVRSMASTSCFYRQALEGILVSRILHQHVAR